MADQGHITRWPDFYSGDFEEWTTLAFLKKVQWGLAMEGDIVSKRSRT